MSDDAEPTELPPLYIRERMKLPPKVTGDELASRMNTTPPTISRLLNGQRKMTLAWLYAFSKALETPIAEFFTPPSSEPRTPEEALRSAMLAFGVDKDELGKAVSAVRLFLDEEDAVQSSPTPPGDQPEPASPHRVKVPSR